MSKNIESVSKEQFNSQTMIHPNLASGDIYRMTAQNQTEKNFVQVKKLMLTK